ncbi:MAG: glycosyltransferase family 2 protein [Mollicutes bacterium]|nr:glycosyltransferase family 2 protein [Mollicutes bacterium]
MKTKVSVIVPVYNVPEKYLEKCVSSLVNQTLNDIEIILVDDGTPDTSGKLCDDFAIKDSRIKVIHQENKGLCGARNTGVKSSIGEWISFVDGDDWIEPDAYEKLYNIGTKNNVDVVMFGYVKDYPSKSVIMLYDKYFENEKVYNTSEDITYLQKMILNYNANCAMAPTKFIRKSIIEKYNIYHDEKLRQGAEGIEFNIRLFSKIKSALFLNETFYHYIYNDESITTVHNEKNHQMVIECFKKIKSEINNDDSEIMGWFYNRMKYVILTTAISGYFSSSNKEPYKIQKRKFKKYMFDTLVQETLKSKNYQGLSTTRKVTLSFIKHRLFLLVKIISMVRTKQKSR